MKIDLHIHSPASRCFKDEPSADIAGRIIQKAVDTGLEMIGITDHHTVDFIADIQAAAIDKPLTVLPGVELSFAVGDLNNVYLLAMFPENTPFRDLNRMLKSWRIPDSAKGNCHYRMETGIDRVIHNVRQAGGILISGHTDKDETRKRAIPLLINHYGIKLFDLKYSHTAAEIQQQFPNQTTHCFTFSDSHRIADIGSKHSEVNLRRGSFKGFRDITCSGIKLGRLRRRLFLLSPEGRGPR